MAPGVPASNGTPGRPEAGTASLSSASSSSSTVASPSPHAVSTRVTRRTPELAGLCRPSSPISVRRHPGGARPRHFHCDVEVAEGCGVERTLLTSSRSVAMRSVLEELRCDTGGSGPSAVAWIALSKHPRASCGSPAFANAASSASRKASSELPMPSSLFTSRAVYLSSPCLTRNASTSSESASILLLARSSHAISMLGGRSVPPWSGPGRAALPAGHREGTVEARRRGG
mmetsp:Transcript_53213/g.158597  ORF Transcript_53213/g.158597 Transcript_53213/m.158597 type:complete len:230 (-) Transcript_53213:187-876(-)